MPKRKVVRISSNNKEGRNYKGSCRHLLFPINSQDYFCEQTPPQQKSWLRQVVKTFKLFNSASARTALVRQQIYSQTEIPTKHAVNLSNEQKISNI